MRTVLFVTFYFPPSETIATRRTGGLAKYLPLYGWRVVVLTPRQTVGIPGSFERLVTDYEDKVQKWRRRLHLHDGESLSMPQTADYVASPSAVQKLRKWTVVTARNLLTYPDSTSNWYRPAVRAGKGFLAKEGADVILSSLGPLTCHIVASTLARDSRVPWVADYRDPWSSNPYTSHDWLLRAVDRQLEAHVTASASAFIGVSRALTDSVARCHPGVRAFMVPNGYDPEEKVTDAKSLDPKFTIVHCGSLYGGKRNPNMLFEAVALLIDEGLMRRDDVRIDFYGPAEPTVDLLSHTYRLDGVVVQHGMVSRDKATAAERSAQVLLIVLSSSSDDTGLIAGKVFEYLAARRPIVAAGTMRGELAELLAMTNTGAQAVSTTEMREWVLAAYRDYVEHGHVEFRCNEDAVEQFSQVEMAKRVAGVLDHVCEHGSPGSVGCAGAIARR